MELNEEKRFQISILDMETAEIVLLDTNQYFLSHEEDDKVVIRTEKVGSQEGLLTMLGLKRMLYETLKKEIVRYDSAAPTKELDALFDEVFNEMLEEVMKEPIDLVDGDTTYSKDV